MKIDCPLHGQLTAKVCQVYKTMGGCRRQCETKKVEKKKAPADRQGRLFK